MLPSVNCDLRGCPKQPFPGHAVRGCVRRPGGKRAGAGNQRGGSLIEFTLVMPVLLVTMTGMVSFGFALHNELVLTNAVNAGAQQLAFSRGQTTDPCATAYSAISSAAPSLTTGLSLSFVINGSTYASTTSCTSGASNMVQGASAQVTATYPCTLAVFGMNFPSCHVGTQVTEFIQ
jgi:Flp pilus assembly protein TadG